MDTHQTSHTHTNAVAPSGIAAIDSGIDSGVGIAREPAPGVVNSMTTQTPAGTLHYPEAVRINVAAAIAGVSRRTIYNWIARGWVECRYLPSGATLVVVSSLVQQIRPAERGPQQPPRRKAAA